MPHDQLDWPFFTDEHRAFAGALRTWAADLPDAHPADVDAECKALVRQLGDGGWLRHVVPAAYGRLVLMIMTAENELFEKKIIELDGRPSDCLALAIQQHAPIYVSRDVWEEVEDRSDVLKSLEEGGQQGEPET